MTTNPRLRATLISAALVLLGVAACSGGTMTPTEYVEGLNQFVATAAPEIDGSVADYAQISNPTMDDWGTFVEREIAIRRQLQERFAELDPPRSLVEIHDILQDALDRGLAAAEALPAVAETAATPAEAEQTPEFAEYVASNSEGSSTVCRAVQTELDQLAADTATLSDEPWLSGLRLTATAALGCLPAESE